MIQPTVGRVILIRGRHAVPPKEQPEAALVAFVHEDGTINVAGFDAHGMPFAAHNVRIPDEGDPAVPQGIYAAWMPYQVGQAAKTEEALQQLAAATGGEPTVETPVESGN
jgi:hypothetical protein